MNGPADWPGTIPNAPGLEEMKAKVVLAGAPGVGKTSLVRRYVLNEFGDRYLHTLGAVPYKRTVDVEVWAGRAIRVTITVWDTMGRLDQSPLHELDLYGAQGVLAVCDVTDAESVPPLRVRLNATLRASSDVPVHILLNKADLGPTNQAKTAGLRAGLEGGAPCYLTSAKAGDNVVAAFEDLARRMVERTLLPRTTFDTVDRQILVACASEPVTVDAVSRQGRIPLIFAEARLERLRRNGFLQFAALGLDAAGRPEVRYGRTRKAFQLVPIEHA